MLTGMAESRDLRLVQLARLLNRAIESESDAVRAIAHDPATLGAALVDEAAQNDDVVSSAAALDYLDTRLAFFGPLVGDRSNAVREAFAERLEAWDSPKPA